MIPTAFIYNVDECGFQSWADKITEKVVVPNEVEETSTNIGIDRASRRATLIGCVCADGSTLKPFIIITRKTKENNYGRIGIWLKCCGSGIPGKWFCGWIIVRLLVTNNIFSGGEGEKNKISVPRSCIAIVRWMHCIFIRFLFRWMYV